MSRRTQINQVYDLLNSTNPDGLTRMQIANCLGIERATICRRVAELRDARRIWVIRKALCPVTGKRAEFLSTNLQVALSAHGKPLNKEVKVEDTGKLF